MITIYAPAKINLTLEVLGKRADGYHEVRSIIQAISLEDILAFEEADKLEFHSGLSEWIIEKSLVSKAADLLIKTTGVKRGAYITVEKHIPLLSGLGGDSSDAAATLLGLNRLWKLELDSEQIVSLARQLGSDIPFFLNSGTALVTGRGEEVTPLPSLPIQWVVLTIPAITKVPGKTGLLYNSLKPGHYTDGHITGNLVEIIKSGREFDYGVMFNTFENVAFDIFPSLDIIRRQIIDVGAPNIHLAGSGPTLFSTFRHEKDAAELHSRLISQEYESYLVSTLSNG
jgi:4-diphosphocytidyl-2-C-methyl-D-erythritol kinase